jgi:serine/threonine protein kinase
MAKTVNGRERVWQIEELVGSGDAGEVLRVSSQPGNLQGVLKRPVQNVSGGTIVRQAGQIETEGKILAVLEGLNFSKNSLIVHTPLLLDRSIEGTSSTVNLFIISEEIRGKSISSLLAERLTSGQPIPQNVVLKVLSSLLLLLEKIHSKGVVWNDVKMDHIFWNAEAKTMSFIDWGNGLFFQPQPDPQNSPVWQDYTQMVEEGLNLLNQTSPHLIQDLGWPLYSSALTTEEIPQLRMRVEYLETYLTMRAIEYELLFERFTKSMPDLDALSQTLDLNQELLQFGINTDLSRLLASVQELLLKYLSLEDYVKVDQIMNLIETSLKEALPLEWQLVSYLLKLKENIASNKLNELLNQVLASSWVDAIWQARELIESGSAVKELAAAIYAMRSLYLDSDTFATIYADLQTFQRQLQEQVTYLQTSSPNSTELVNYLTTLLGKVDEIASHWSILAPDEVLGNQLFNLRQVLSEAASIRLKLPEGLSDRLQMALATARDVYQNWNAADLDASLKALKKLYALEPTLDYLLLLAESLIRMKNNLSDFESGPDSDQSVNSFADNLLGRADDLIKHLGIPDWLGNYNLALNEMSRAINLENLQDLARRHDWSTQWVY